MIPITFIVHLLHKSEILICVRFVLLLFFRQLPLLLLTTAGTTCRVLIQLGTSGVDAAHVNGC